MATRTITRYRTRTVRSKRRKKAAFTVPLAVVAGFVPNIMFAWEMAKVGDWDTASKRLVSKLTGYNAWNQTWDYKQLVSGWTPILLGILGHKMANKLGINRAISAAGIPWVRI